MKTNGLSAKSIRQLLDTRLNIEADIHTECRDLTSVALSGCEDKQVYQDLWEMRNHLWEIADTIKTNLNEDK